MRVLDFLWLQAVLGINTAKVKKIMTRPDHIADAEWLMQCKLSPVQRKNAQNLAVSSLQHVQNQCERSGVDIITFEDERYPKLLLEVECPPVVLFTAGDVGLLKHPRLVALVGTRRPSSAGFKQAVTLAQQLSRRGLVTVSGLASGIDTAAHLGALDIGFPTVAVLGTGHNITYPAANRTLQRNIAKHGLVVSEYPPDERYRSFTFLQRNRIIAGLCRATVVGEANVESGSLNTARHAKEAGRKLFTLPEQDYRYNKYSGTQQLTEQGAQEVSEPQQILRFYDGDTETMLQPQQLTLNVNCKTAAPKPDECQTQKESAQLSPQHSEVLKCVAQGALQSGIIAQETGIKPAQVNGILFSLESKGFVMHALSGYVLTQKGKVQVKAYSP